ncbi:MAG: hypothetical protein K2X35_03900 [Bryobacteraceae bacterium]|nr:hypothetical protein [Bryobacteraceae bacterium]
MIRQFWAFVFLAAAVNASGQSAPAEWDTRQSIDALVRSLERAKPLLEQAEPDKWVSRGASDVYVQQFQSLKHEIEAGRAAAADFSRKPDQISPALALYLRLESLENRMNSIVEGIRRYQNPALADLVQSQVSEVTTNRERLGPLLLDLAKVREQEFQIADQEAQRCRGSLSRQPVRKKTAEPPKQEKP